jgi:hypothetical protein
MSKIEQYNQSSFVLAYYSALYSGDLQTVRTLMTRKSYLMLLESFGLGLSFNDPDFRVLLSKIEEDRGSLEAVEEKLSKDIASRHLSPNIRILKTNKNGKERRTIHYREDGKEKKLYFSRENDVWKINYFAGRKVA